MSGRHGERGSRALRRCPQKGRSHRSALSRARIPVTLQRGSGRGGSSERGRDGADGASQAIRAGPTGNARIPHTVVPEHAQSLLAWSHSIGQSEGKNKGGFRSSPKHSVMVSEASVARVAWSCTTRSHTGSVSRRATDGIADRQGGYVKSHDVPWAPVARSICENRKWTFCFAHYGLLP